MTALPVQLEPHTRTIVDRLKAAGLRVGDHVAPTTGTPPAEATPPYSVLYLLPGGEADGTVESPSADALVAFQVTSVGRLASEAFWQADKVRVALVDEVLEVDGRSLGLVELTMASGGARRDDDTGSVGGVPTSPLFYAVDRFSVWSFPA